MNTFFEFSNLGRHFEREDSFIKVSGTINPGEIMVVRGPSGSGKSTLLKILARLIKPDTGTVIYKDQEWLSISPVEWRKKIHYVPQKPVMFEGNVMDNFSIPFKLKSIQQEMSFDPARAKFIMDMLKLPEDMLEQNAQTLSGGESARVALIRALLINPQILLLDEPTAYLDDESRHRLNELIIEWVKEEPHRAIILVSHQDNDLDKLPNSKVLNINNMPKEVQT